MFVYVEKLTPAAWAAATASDCHVPHAQFAFVDGIVYQPYTSPVTCTAPRDSSSKKLATEPAFEKTTPAAVAGVYGRLVSFEKLSRTTATRFVTGADAVADSVLDRGAGATCSTAAPPSSAVARPVPLLSAATLSVSPTRRPVTRIFAPPR